MLSIDSNFRLRDGGKAPVVQQNREKCTANISAKLRAEIRHRLRFGPKEKSASQALGAPADFAIGRCHGNSTIPLRTRARTTIAAPQYKEVQYQCDYLHHRNRCNIFAIRAISMRMSGLAMHGMSWHPKDEADPCISPQFDTRPPQADSAILAPPCLGLQFASQLNDHFT